MRHVPTLVAALATRRTVQAAAGKSHTLFVTAAGSVLACGWGRTGQLGNGGKAQQCTPVSVSMPAGKFVVSADAGAEHSILVTAGQCAP